MERQTETRNLKEEKKVFFTDQVWYVPSREVLYSYLLLQCPAKGQGWAKSQSRVEPGPTRWEKSILGYSSM